MERLRVVGPYRDSGTIPGEWGYGDYYRAVSTIDGMKFVHAYVCIPNGAELSSRQRANLLARGRRVAQLNGCLARFYK